MEKQQFKNNSNLGKTLRSLRLNNGYGVKELSLHLQLMGVDITRQCLHKIEAGTHHVPVELIRALHTIYHVSYDVFFEYEEEE